MLPDPDPGDTLSYDWSDTINGVVSNDGRSLTWTAPEIPGQYPVKVTVSDSDGNSTPRTETFTVNTLPTVVVAASVSTVAAGGTVTISVSITDIDDVPAILNHFWDAHSQGSWDAEPILVTSTGNQAQYSRVWRAPSQSVTGLRVGFSATDTCGSGSDYVTIDVVGRPPTVTIEPDSASLVLTTPVAQQEQFTARATDPEDGIIDYRWSITGTANGTLDSSVSQTVTYRPTAVGQDTLTVVVTDEDGLTATDSVNITVVAPMTAPTIRSLTAGKTTLDPNESTIIVCDTTYTTATVRWSVGGPGTLSDGADNLSQVLTADTNVRAGTTIAVSCRLTNDFGFTTGTVNITVNNVAPEITGSRGVPNSITLSGSFRPILSVVDLNGDSVNYNWSSDTFIISSSTAASPRITPDIQLGTFILSCTVSDNPPIGHISLTDTIDFSVSVTQLPQNNPPTVTISGDTEIFDNGTSTLDADGEDIDGHDITYAWSIVSGTGRISRTTGTRTVFTPDGLGNTTIECVVTDEPGDEGSDQITIEVIERVVVNNPPNVRITGSTVVHVLSTLNLSTVVSDPDNDTIAIYAWGVTSGNGRLSPTNRPSTTFTPDGEGDSVITCEVIDSRGALGTDTHTVTARNRSPSVSISGQSSISLTETATLTARGSDPDGAGDISGYTWEIESGNGRLSRTTGTTTVFTPDGEGDTLIQCEVTDRSGATGDATHTVSTVNRPPSVTIFGDTVGLVSQGISLEARGSDPDGAGDISGYTWSVEQGSGRLSRTTGTRVTYTPSSTPETSEIMCVVTDRGGATGEDTHEITTYRLPSLGISVNPTDILVGASFGVGAINVSNADDVTIDVSPSTYATATEFPGRIWRVDTASNTPSETVFTVTLTATNPGGSATATGTATAYGVPTASISFISQQSRFFSVALGYSNGNPSFSVNPSSGTTTQFISDVGTFAYWSVTIDSSVASGTVITATGEVTNPADSASDSIMFTVG